MPDRVFPSTEQNLGTEKEFNGIKMDTLAACLAEVREAGKMPSEVLEKFKAMSGKGSKKDDDDEGDKDGEKEASAKRAKKQLPPAFLENIKGKGKKDEGKGEGKGKGEFVREGVEASTSTRVRRVAFVKPEQLSAEAVIAAKAAGDEPLVQAILAERQNRRMRLAAKLVDDTASQIDRQQKVAKRNTFRMNVIAKTEDTKKVLAAASKTAKTAKTADAKGFKTVAAMNTAEKDEFVRKVVASGFPREYALAMLGTPEQDAITAAEQAMRDVMSSNMPDATKRTVLSGMVKEAKLDSEQVNRQLRYWKDDLGYGDTEWVDDLFSKKYDN